VAECPAAKELFDKASAILGYDLLQVCTEGEQLGAEALGAGQAWALSRPGRWAGLRRQLLGACRQSTSRAAGAGLAASAGPSQAALSASHLAS
jgi:hypothetical protein